MGEPHLDRFVAASRAPLSTSLADELPDFQVTGPSWKERAGLGELEAVLSPGGSERRNRFLHGVSMRGAQLTAQLAGNRGTLLDFGCGTGRFLRYFAKRGFTVVGTEITPEMLTALRALGQPEKAALLLVDGIHLPLASESVDVIWCCGVLRFSLFVPDPSYAQIAREMHRVLRPGGLIANVEICVEVSASTFTKDFEAAGFSTLQTRILNRHYGVPEALAQARWMPRRLAALGGYLTAEYRRRFDRIDRLPTGLRDYLFLWSKERRA